MKIITSLLLPLGILISGCSAKYQPLENYQQKAEQLAQSILIIDTHVDVPYRLQRKDDDISIATEGGDFDHPRAVKGGLNVPFMSIYTPAKIDGTAESYILANQLIDSIEKIIQQSPDKFMAACSSQDAEKSLTLNKIALPMGMENGAPLAGNLKNLEHFWKRGIRYITLTHSKSNHISDSSYDTERQWNGLSDFGKKLIPQMNKLGIMIDISHVSDITFYQVMELSKVPVIASHSSVRAFIPGFERNMSDEMILKLAENKGVIQLNFGSTFLLKSARVAWDTFREAKKQFIVDHNLVELQDGAEVKAFETEYKNSHPELWANVEDVLDHVDYIVTLTSIDNIGIGSDYDGVGDTLPMGLKDVSTFPVFIEGLLKRGYSEADIKKILSGNTLRVWKAVEQYATEQGTETRHCSSGSQG